MISYESLGMGKTSKYQLLDSGNGRRLEQVGGVRLIRPAAQAIWSPSLDKSEWQQATAEFIRRSDGNGSWKVSKGQKLPEQWQVEVSERVNALIRPTDFGHLGLFAEHHHQKPLISAIEQAQKVSGKPLKVLNLFGYTGIPTLELAHTGAELTHVDASKASVNWARENLAVSKLQQSSIRWIVEDVVKYVARLVRRGEKFAAILLDPPSFGRGTKNEVWKLEEHLPGLLEQLKLLIDDDHFAFFQISAHSQTTSAQVLRNLLVQGLGVSLTAVECGEMSIPAASRKSFELPCGAFARTFLSPSQKVV